MKEGTGSSTVSPVTWYVGVVEITTSEGKRLKLNLGYCSLGKGVAFVSTNALSIYVIRSVSTWRVGNEVQCMDAKWCFNLKCSLNRAVPGMFKQYSISTREELEKAHMFLEKCVEKIKAIYGEEFFEQRDDVVVFNGPLLTVQQPDKYFDKLNDQKT